MIQAVLYGARDLRLEEASLEADVPSQDQVLVETEITAMSTGTELGAYLGASTDVPGAPGYPRPIGYSNVGVVVSTGKAVRGFRAGHRVFSMKPHQSVYLASGGDLLVPVPGQVSSEAASLAYLTELGLAAIRQADYEPGESIAVIGLGVIGLCTVALARCLGARAIGIANSERRRSRGLVLLRP